MGDIEFFPLRDDGETPAQARSRIRALLSMWGPTEMFRWSVKARPDGALVKKIGKWSFAQAVRTARILSPGF